MAMPKVNVLQTFSWRFTVGQAMELDGLVGSSPTLATRSCWKDGGLSERLPSTCVHYHPVSYVKLRYRRLQAWHKARGLTWYGCSV